MTVHIDDDEEEDEHEGVPFLPLPKVNPNPKVLRPRGDWTLMDEVWLILSKDAATGTPSKGRIVMIFNLPFHVSTYYVIEVMDGWHPQLEVRTVRTMAATEAAAKCLSVGEKTSSKQRLNSVLRRLT